MPDKLQHRDPSPKGSRQPGKGAAARSNSADRPTAPAPATNRKGVLAGHEEEIARLYAEGRRVSSIARTFGVSSNAIKKCLALPRRAPNKNTRQWGKRFSKCVACWAPIAVNGTATRGFCESCTQRAFETIVVYDRDKSIGELPPNLRHYAEE
jgi:hypothetical protein